MEKLSNGKKSFSVLQKNCFFFFFCGHTHLYGHKFRSSERVLMPSFYSNDCISILIKMGHILSSYTCVCCPSYMLTVFLFLFGVWVDFGFTKKEFVEHFVSDWSKLITFIDIMEQKFFYNHLK